MPIDTIEVSIAVLRHRLGSSGDLGQILFERIPGRSLEEAANRRR